MKFFKKTKRTRAGENGGILVIALFVLSIITLFSLTVGMIFRQKAQNVIRIDDRQKLRFVADAAAKASVYQWLIYKQTATAFEAFKQSWAQNEAAFKEIKVGDGVFSIFYAKPQNILAGETSAEEKIYGLIDEGRKINPAFASPDILFRLIKKTTLLADKEAKILADSIFDWIDTDNNALPNGAESYFYHDSNPAYDTRNKKPSTLEELRLVRGMTDEIFEQIKSFLTIYGDGQVNLNTASKQVLYSLGFSDEVCDEIEKYRNGADQKEGTKDDKVFEDIGSAQQTLLRMGALRGGRSMEFERILENGGLGVQSKFFTAQIEARFLRKKQILQVEMVFNEKGNVEKWAEKLVVV